MNLQGITSGVQTGKKAAAAPAQKEQEAKEARRDSVQVTGQTASAPTGVYTKSQLNKTQAQTLMDEQQARMDSFLKLIQSMVAGQGQTSKLTLMEVDLYVTPEQSAQAAAAIAPGGEYSVDAVAGRIMDMAKALAGGDPSKLDALRDAVGKGFQAAGAQLGCKLPGICDDTYSEVMRRFGDWEKELSGVSAASGAAL